MNVVHSSLTCVHCIHILASWRVNDSRRSGCGYGPFGPGNQLTLRSLSAACGLSVGFLSQIERGLSSFSISSLRSICQALNVSLADVLVMPNSSGNAVLVDPRHFSITKADNRSYVSLSDASVRYRFLSAGFPGRRFEAVIGELAAADHSEPHVHEGEEFWICPRG